MAMNTHTPGLWHVMPQTDPSRLDIQSKDDAGYTVASAWGGGNAMEEAMQSNAHLIAAAPALLAALVMLRDRLTDKWEQENPDAAQAMNDAIKEALPNG